MSLIASSSRTLLRSAFAHAARARPYSAAPDAAPPSPVPESSPASAPPAPAPVAPLPGSSVLPEAFRAPAPTPSAPASRTPRSAAHLASSPSLSGRPSHRMHQPYTLHVYSTRNNTILTLSTSPAASASSSSSSSSADPHHPVAWVSSGSAGYKGAARGTYDAAVEVTLRMFKKIQDLVQPPVLAGGQRVKAAGPPPTELEVVWKGFGQGRDAVFRTLMGAEGDRVRGLVKRVTDATPLKIGGTRPKKRRVI
ncbi:hypothetical protein Rhopal_001402-T1 [Rhodotorula paludigena]|uniref:Ribosomal protein S11 n=1 Tax=Rhodotorula paludigena TaxID=86838 RepID=A0AAV5GFP1_9BASI|nr:hypothetical protein Rhopal_001402-T1 [Rhodotorula paludigena]